MLSHRILTSLAASLLTIKCACAVLSAQVCALTVGREECCLLHRACHLIDTHSADGCLFSFIKMNAFLSGGQRECW